MRIQLLKLFVPSYLNRPSECFRWVELIEQRDSSN